MAIGVILVAACGGGAGESDAAGADAEGADAPRGDAAGLIDAGPTTSMAWNASNGLPSDACVPFVLTSSGANTDAGIEEGALVFASTMASDLLYYAHETELLSFDHPTTVKATLQVNTSTSDRESRAFAGIGVRLGGADRDVILQIGEDVIFLAGSAAEPRLAEVARPTTDGFHTYRLVVDPTTFAVEVFYDGASVLTGTAELAGADIDDRIYWGDISGFAAGRMRWESLSHDALLTPVTCP